MHLHQKTSSIYDRSIFRIGQGKFVHRMIMTNNSSRFLGLNLNLLLTLNMFKQYLEWASSLPFHGYGTGQSYSRWECIIWLRESYSGRGNLVEIGWRPIRWRPLIARGAWYPRITTTAVDSRRYKDRGQSRRDGILARIFRFCRSRQTWIWNWLLARPNPLVNTSHIHSSLL